MDEQTDTSLRIQVPPQLDAASVAEYEAIEHERTAHIDHGEFETCTAGFGGWYERHYRGRGYLVFRGTREHYRQYEWS